MLTAYSRVTVVTDDRRVDLALPSALPLADVVAQVIRYCGAADAPQTGLALARVGGPALGFGQTLEEAGILDGDVLELRPRSGGVEPASVEDVRDAVEDEAEAAGGAWTPRTTLTFSLVTTAVVLGVLALWAAGVLESLARELAPPPTESVTAAGAACAVVLAAMAGWGARAAAPWTVRPLLVVALLWAWVAGAALGEWSGWSTSTNALAGFAAAAVVAGLARALTPAATAYVAFAAVLLLVAAVFAVTIGLDVEAVQTLRVVVVLALLAVGTAPRVSLSVGGLASADYRVRHVGTMSRDEIRRRYRESNAILVGSLAAVAFVTGVGGTVLTVGDGRWDRWLALAVALLAMSRSRVFSRTAHMLPLRIAGLVVVAAQVVREVVEEGRGPWLVAIALVAGIVAVAISSIDMSSISRARVKRLLNLAELLLVIQAIVLACGAAGLFARVSGMF